MPRSRSLGTAAMLWGLRRPNGSPTNRALADLRSQGQELAREVAPLQAPRKRQVRIGRGLLRDKRALPAEAPGALARRRQDRRVPLQRLRRRARQHRVDPEPRRGRPQDPRRGNLRSARRSGPTRAPAGPRARTARARATPARSPRPSRARGFRAHHSRLAAAMRPRCPLLVTTALLAARRLLHRWRRTGAQRGQRCWRAGS
mmetsp:Transcript_77082/g.213018  ORF Transcript_77082/g.213018 Transcript_77082/m.213018 type:complete len:202 (+) Transcript_77082:887-1492(+)